MAKKLTLKFKNQQFQTAKTVIIWYRWIWMRV